MTAALRNHPDWACLREDIVAHAIRFSDHLHFDMRLVLTQAAALARAGRLMWALARPFRPDVLVGPGLGAAPLLFAMALEAGREGVTVNVLMVRDKRKQHNQKKWVEGHRPPPGALAVMVDDFMAAGSALPLVEQALQADGCDVALQAVLLFFDMWEPLGSRQISAGRCPVVSLFKRHDVGLSRDCHDAKPPAMRGEAPEFLGEPLWWRWHLNDKAFYPYKSVPVVADGAVFVADDHCRLWRHDWLTGDIVWCRESLHDAPKGIVQQLQHADGSLVFGCYDGTVTRVDAGTGEVRWRWRQDSSIHATPRLDLRAGRLYVNTEQWNNGQPFGHLQALDWATGRLLWRTPHAYWPPGSPALHAATNTVVAPCNDRSLVAVDASTGERRWQRATQGLVRGRPGMAAQAVIVATEAGHLQAFDVRDGATLWTTRYGKGEGHQFVHVHSQQGGDLVYAFDAKWHLTAFDARTGAIRWLTRLRSPGCWGPAAFGPYLIALSRQGHLAVLQAADGLKLWEGQVPGHYRQPGAIGWVPGRGGRPQAVFAAASNDRGLQVFPIHPFYAPTP